MREILYHRHAVRHLKRMPEDRKEQIKAAIAVAVLPDARVNFRIAGPSLEVLHAGPRGDID